MLVTIKDVAKQAGVSVSAVSRVLNSRPDVSTATREKIQAVIRELGYVQNSNAKNLKKNFSNVVCIIVKGRQNLFLGSVLEIIEAETEKSSYIPIVHYIDESDDEVVSASKLLIDRKPVGIIFLGGTSCTHGEELRKIGIPCVYATISAQDLQLPNVSSVCVDDEAAARKAINYLMDHGHTRIAVLGGRRLTQDLIHKRYSGILGAFSDHGLRFDESLYFETLFSIKDAYRITSGALETSEFTAVFAMSDLLAIGATKAVLVSGLRVPEDISVIGFDGLDIVYFFNPSLATIKQPAEEIAVQSVGILVENIRGCRGAEHVVLSAELIPGASVKTHGNLGITQETANK